ncbi:hypothetical protein [Erysipelothrix anatis]|uniref:hypothetical protein n=1 Tax=Erysipelothrix anatis TaxID=2683713 RepID=UPI00135AC19D|nr:hypothetical protein [Erysipelothrix anatis]
MKRFSRNYKIFAIANMFVILIFLLINAILDNRQVALRSTYAKLHIGFMFVPLMVLVGWTIFSLINTSQKLPKMMGWLLKSFGVLVVLGFLSTFSLYCIYSIEDPETIDDELYVTDYYSMYERTQVPRFYTKVINTYLKENTYSYYYWPDQPEKIDQGQTHAPSVPNNE